MKRMHKYLITILCALSIHQSNAQFLSCEDDIEICNNQFVMELGSEVFFAEICFTYFSGDLGLTECVYVENIENGVVSFPIPLPIQNTSGTYYIYDENGNSCWGSYTAQIGCSDYIIPIYNPDCQNDYVANGQLTACDMQNVIQSDFNVTTHCIGDTSYIGISQDKNNIDAGYKAPFHPERLSFNNGYIIDYDDFGFNIVWDKVGEDCLILSTEVEYYFEDQSGILTDIIRNSKLANIKPKTPLTIINDYSNETIEVCIGEEVNLYSEDPAKDLKWTVDNGLSYYGHNVKLSFDIPGTYLVTLSDVTSCNCSIPDTYTIIVEPGDTPGIQCTGTICLGDEVTYYSENICDTYDWSVSSEGTIVDGGTTEDYFITVLWNSGPLGQISLSTPGCLEVECIATKTIDIPIITDGALITGPDTVCFRSFYIYTATEYEGTEFTWSIPSGNGAIWTDENSKSVQTKWGIDDPSNIGIIQLDYENCNLGCSGTTQYEVLLVDQIKLIDESTVECEYAEIKMANSHSKNVSWSILYPDGNWVEYPLSNELHTTLFDPGIYKILMYNQDHNTCNYYDSIQFTVYPFPDPPDEILGSDVVCKDAFGKYEVTNLQPYDQVYWEIYDGNTSTPSSTSFSQELYYTWKTSGPYEIHASIQNGLSGCISDATIRIWEDMYEILRADTTCIYSKPSYHIQSEYDGDVNWSIIPNNAGTILHALDDSVSVLWQGYGDHQLIADYCNHTEIINVHIPNYSPTITIDNACKDEMATILINTEDGSTYSIEDTDGNISPIGSSSSRSKGKYKITATSKYGCVFEKFIEIKEYSPFSINIYYPTNFSPCATTDQVLTADDLGEGYTYAWYYYNLQLSSTTHQLTIYQDGLYSVEVTDPNGCIATDTISFNCNTSGCPIIPINTVDVDVEMQLIDIDCNHKEFEIIPPYESTDFDWYIDRELFQSGGVTATHTFTKAGHYHILANGNGGCDTLYFIDCMEATFAINVCEEANLNITVPVVAYFDNGVACMGEAMQFIDKSSILPGTTGLVYHWDFGDPASGVSNTSNEINPEHVYSDTDIHVVTLTITHPSGCTTTNSKQVYATAFPTIDIAISDENCVGFETYFSPIAIDNNLTYLWDFGDTLLGVPSTSIDEHASYIYTNDDIYTVSLSATNENGCTTTTSKDIEIITNNIYGNITSDTSYPKCQGDPAVLTINTNADSYVWSTGDTTKSITVVDPGSYSVTLTNDQGCQTYSSSHHTKDFILGDAVIYASTYGHTFGSASHHFDSLTICIGESFNLSSSIINNVSYEWSNGNNNSTLNFDNNFASLLPGNYTYYLRVQELNIYCHDTLGPFFVRIIDLPTQPIINTPLTPLCENDISTLTIDSPNPNTTYQWSTGHIGTSLTVSTSGRYSVSAINELGCAVDSDPIDIYPTPPIAAWLSGCLETCFPKEICLSLDENLTYQLMKNETTSTTISNDSTLLLITEPGDYQLLATNSDGCTAISDMLSLTSSPEEHSLSGIVYFDHNENGEYDAGDELLPDIPVTLFSGNTPLYNTLTNLSGSYQFDTVAYINLTAVIDPTVTDYTFIGNTDSLLIYDTCIEDKEINFPLTPNCSIVERDTIYMLCAGQTITIDGESYGADDMDTLIYPLSINCDSIVRIRIDTIPNPTINITTDSTCVDSDNGVLFIDNVMMTDVIYTLDSDPTPLDEETISGLSAGYHELHVYDNYGCGMLVPFTIVEIAEPEINIISSSACSEGEGGSIQLQIIQGDGLAFSLNENNDFNSDLTIENLSAGHYTLYIKDVNGCNYSQPFTVDLLPPMIYNISTENSCNADQGGTLYINEASSGMTFSLDGIQYIDTGEFNDLPSGSYNLYIENTDGCQDTTTFIIEALTQPSVEYIIQDNCEGFNNGAIYIDSAYDGYQYGINEEVFTNDLIFTELPVGDHTLFILTDENCIYTIDFDIQPIPTPNIEIIKENTCLDEENGTINIINNSENDILFSIDNINFNEEILFIELAADDYIVYAMTAENCIYEYPIKIEELPIPTLDATATNSCYNDKTGLIYINSDIENLDIYLDNELITSNEINNLSAGIYQLNAINEFNCANTIEISLDDYPELIVEIPEINQDCHFDPLVIRPEIISSHGKLIFDWSNGSNSEFISVKDSGPLHLTIFDECSMYEHQWDLTFGIDITSDLVYVPNIFSPNADGNNDCFISTLDPRVVLLDYHQMVFDRWGNRMYLTTDINDCWDGTFQGEPVRSGVFVYVTDMLVDHCGGTEKIRKIGDVTVIY